MTALLTRRSPWHLIAIAAHCAGCLGGGSSDGNSGGPPGGSPPPSANRAPTITGTPNTSLSIDQNYEFRPNASDPDGDALTFRIENRPAWATFESTTGRLYGRPGAGDVGQFTDIAISVTDGAASAALDPFSIAVDQFALGSVTLSWSPPTTNADGSAIVDLAGYRIYYGQSADALDETVVIDNPGTIRWVIDNLSPATWYFSMTSYKSSGVESTRTPVGSLTLS